MVFFFCLAMLVNAQYRVNPNRPYEVLKSNPGFVSINELTGGIGLNSNSTPYSKHFFGFTSVTGYQLNGNFMAGAGVGLSFYDAGLLIPLFLDFRYSFLPRPFTPYIYADGGLNLQVSSLNDTKLFINPGAGVRYSFGRKIAANVSLGILSQVDGINRASFLTVKAGGVYVF
jgi:hypothetical protein